MDQEPTDSFPSRRREVQKSYQEFATRSRYTIFNADKVESTYRLAISTACWRPELKPLLNDVKFNITDTDKNAFVLLQGEIIAVSSKILAYPAATAFYLRHCLELIALRANLENKDSHIDLMALAIAAFRTALKYLDNMVIQEHNAACVVLPNWIKQVASKVSQCKSQQDANIKSLQIISTVLDKLLPLQEQAYLSDTMVISDSDIRNAIKRALILLPLLYPTEQILTMGGDNRLLISKQSGLNAYGCSPRPRPWAITFSSSTGSSISDLAYQEAEFLRQELLAYAFNGNLIHRCADEYATIRKEISTLLNLERVPGTKVLLTPSGTDSEFYALYFAMGNQTAEIHNIVISSTEIGSGTVYAASGCHFDELTPLGNIVQQNAPLDGFPTHQIKVSILELRHKDGILKTMKEMDQAIEKLTEDSLANGQHVLIHLLDCSKTGIGGPGFEKVKQLRRSYPSLIDVMVDAAQMRVGQSALHRYLEEEFMVLISGSKFFTGPPFSGALLVPPSLSKRVQDFTTFPTGFADYSTAYELPADWQHLTTSVMKKEANFGLLLRWRAALWEMKAFHSVTALEQFNTISNFGSRITQMIIINPDLELVLAPPHTRGYLGSDLCWDQLPTIFTFIIYHHNSAIKRQPLSYDEARFAYQCINIDIARFLPVQASDREYELARKRCHIGQPVRLQDSNGEWMGGLRISAGARLVSGVEFDDAFGSTPEERLETEIRTAGVVFRKLSVIVKYWKVLNSYDLSCCDTPGTGYYQF